VVVIDAVNRVSIRPVKTGERVGQNWIITEGVKPGEEVIADGIQKAKQGGEVRTKQFKPAGQGD
jgi:membrane fusion protein (multidrug efflux system)